MATQKKNWFSTITYIAAGVITLGAAATYVTAAINKKIDERVDCKTKYMIILLEKIATPEQKRAADEEFERWNKQ